MVDNVAIEARHESSAASHMVLLVSKDGTVCSVLETPGSLRMSQRLALNKASIDDIWPRELADKVRNYIRRTIRDRQFRCDDAENPADNRNYEFICVPQGRDRVLLVVRDVSKTRTNLSRITHLAYTDKVTELPNREFFDHELQKITDVQRLKEGRAAVICIHVEQFDDDGHALIAGHEDDFLKEVASRLKTQLRGINDSARADFDRYSVVARTDFRQFSIALPNIECGEDAESVVMRLIAALREPVAIGSHTVVAKAHVGVALFPQDGTDPDALYANAISAVEDARNSIADPFKFHSGTVRLRNLQRQDLATDLKVALQREDFKLNYLPIVDARTGAVTSVEALLRWPETILGTRTTRKIVTIAEYTGLIVNIGEWVLRRSCEQLQICRDAGHVDVRLAVNLSGQEFSRASLVQQVRTILEETGVDPASLDLEIKEQMLSRDATQKFTTSNELKALGVGITIDDFGTGTCTLAHLSRSRIDGIKIDNSFVANIEENEQDRAACMAAIALGHGLGIRVIAEGVETDGQARFLRENDCDLLQGFLFCEPLTGDELIKYLDDAAQGESDRVFGS